MARAERWTLLRLLETTTKYFSDKQIQSPRIDAELLLAHILEKRRIDLYVAYDQPMTDAETDRYRDAVKRRARGEPVQRICEETEFYSLPIKMEPGVLIPRPETELLVDQAVAFARRLDGEATLRVLDAGTGTGAIAIALARHVPAARILAVDLATEAVACAKSNAERNDVSDRVQIIHGDWAEVLADQSAPFDLILANPPYVTTAEMDELPVEVRDHDPGLALHGGDDGLDPYRTLIPPAARALREGGALLLEISDTISNGVVNMLKNEALTKVTTSRDYAGHERVASARK